MKKEFDGPKTFGVDTAGVERSLNDVLNWENEKYRRFGLWKKWPLINIAFQRRKLERGEITLERFRELRKMFLDARYENEKRPDDFSLKATRSKP